MANLAVWPIPRCDFTFNEQVWEVVGHENPQNLWSLGPGEFAGRSRLLQCVSWNRGGEAGCGGIGSNRKGHGLSDFDSEDDRFGEGETALLGRGVPVPFLQANNHSPAE